MKNQETTKKKYLLLDMTGDKHREFKAYCASQGLSMKDVLINFIESVIKK